MLNLQVQFQKNTQMDGGDNFSMRFWTAEAARLGQYFQDYIPTAIIRLLSTTRFFIAGEADKRRM